MDVVVQSGHQINVTGIAFAPDGRSLATCSADESVRLWDLGLGCEAGVLQGHRGPVYRLAYTADGRLLASGGWDHDVRIWDVDARACIAVLKGITRHPVNDLALSADGSRAAATGSGRRNVPRQLLVWEIPTGRRLVYYELPDQGSRALALSSDGERLAFADAHGRIDLLELGTRNRRTLIADLDPVVDLLFTAGGAELLVLTDRLLRLDLAAGQRLSAQQLPVEPAAESDEPEPRSPQPAFRLSLLADGTPVLHGRATTHFLGAPARSLLLRSDAVSPDGGLLARATGRHVELVDVPSRQVVRRLGGRLNIQGVLGNMHRQFVLATSPTEPLIAAGAPDGLLRLWDLARSPSPTVFPAHNREVDGLAFSPDGSLLASGGSGRLRIWPRTGGPPVLDVQVDGGVRHLRFSAEGSAVVVGTWGRGVRALTLDGEVIAVTEDEQRPEALAVSPWNDVAVGGANHVKIWQPFLAADPVVVPMPTQCNDADIALDGRLAVGLGLMKWFGLDSAPGLGAVLSRRGGEPTALRGHPASVTCIRFSPDSTHVATGGEDGEVRIWDASNGECQQVITAHAGTVTGIGWLPDGARLVSTGYDGTVRIWDPDGDLVATLISLGDQEYVAVTPDGHYSATRAGLAAIVLRTQVGLHPFEQFDLQLNRPDLLLARIGYAPAGTVSAFAAAHERRLARLRLGPTRAAAGDDQPVLEVLTPPPPVSATGNLTLPVRLSRDGRPLSHLYVTVNDVPVDGRAGRGVEPGGGLVEVAVQLTPGDNELALWCVDEAGSLSQRVGYRVFDSRPLPPRRLFVLAVGVSRYADSALALQFAAKDARDLAGELRSQAHSFAEVRTRVLADATREQILGAPDFLGETRPEDHVVVLLAGHGALLGTDFVFLPADTRTDDLPGTVIRYEDIEGLVDGIPARRRLILLDTCHSGEDDLGPPPAVPASPLPAGVVRGRSFGRREVPLEVPVDPGRVPTSSPAGGPTVNLRDIFADLRQESGAFIIAAAGSAEFALERDDLRNGVFTASVVQALRADPELTVSGLAAAVADRVSSLTGGGQRPMVRRENLADDYRVL